METKYRASLGITPMLITILVSLIFGGFIVFFIYRIIVTTSTAELLTAIVFSLILLLAYVVLYLYRTKYYLVDDYNITIGSYMKEVKISLKNIKDAYLIKNGSIGWSEAVGGNCGVFGYTGDFKNGFGIATWYATQRRNYLMIETIDKGKFVLTPDNIDMVKQIRKLIGK